MPADKDESFLQIDKTIFYKDGKHSPNSQNTKFSMSWQYLVKEVREEVDFLYADKHQRFLQVDFNALMVKIF